MGPVIDFDLPELMRVTCPDCEGVGGFEGDDTQPGRLCDRCSGRCVIEVCEACQLEATIEHGVEVCGCTVAAELRSAA